MALTPSELALLSTLVYADDGPVLDGAVGTVCHDLWHGGYTGRIVAYALGKITDADIQALRSETTLDGTRMSGSDWADVLERAVGTGEVAREGRPRSTSLPGRPSRATDLARSFRTASRRMQKQKIACRIYCIYNSQAILLGLRKEAYVVN